MKEEIKPILFPAAGPTLHKSAAGDVSHLDSHWLSRTLSKPHNKGKNS